MAVDQILTLLIAERDKLNRAIEALGAPAKRRGRTPMNATATAPTTSTPTKKTRKKRTFTSEQRAAQGLRMKQIWARKKKEKAA